jgi:ribosomal-protein-alanine N-acetyltransferase
MSDLSAVLEIEKNSFPKSAYEKQVFIYYAVTNGDNFLVNLDESTNQIKGYIIFYPSGHIISLAVHPSQRRKGIGKNLVEEVLKVALGNAKVEVRESNHGARKFYKKLGFSEIGRISNYYIDEDAVIMKYSR